MILLKGDHEPRQLGRRREEEDLTGHRPELVTWIARKQMIDKKLY